MKFIIVYEDFAVNYTDDFEHAKNTAEFTLVIDVERKVELGCFGSNDIPIKEYGEE